MKKVIRRILSIIPRSVSSQTEIIKKVKVSWGQRLWNEIRFNRIVIPSKAEESFPLAIMDFKDRSITLRYSQDNDFEYKL